SARVTADTHVRHFLTCKEGNHDGSVDTVGTTRGDQVPRGGHAVRGVNHRNPRVDDDVEPTLHRVGVGVLASDTVLFHDLGVVHDRGDALCCGLQARWDHQGPGVDGDDTAVDTTHRNVSESLLQCRNSQRRVVLKNVPGRYQVTEVPFGVDEVGVEPVRPHQGPKRQDVLGDVGSLGHPPGKVHDHLEFIVDEHFPGEREPLTVLGNAVSGLFSTQRESRVSTQHRYTRERLGNASLTATLFGELRQDLVPQTHTLRPEVRHRVARSESLPYGGQLCVGVDDAVVDQLVEQEGKVGGAHRLLQLGHGRIGAATRSLEGLTQLEGPARQPGCVLLGGSLGKLYPLGVDRATAPGNLQFTHLHRP